MLCPWRNATSNVNEDAYNMRGISINWPLALPIRERLVYDGRAVVQAGAGHYFNLTLTWDRNDGLSYSGKSDCW
jgi:hypothetical protein